MRVWLYVFISVFLPLRHKGKLIRLLVFCFLALADGALDPVLTVCAMKEALALLALMTLSHIVEHQGNLAPLIEVSIDFGFCSF